MLEFGLPKASFGWQGPLRHRIIHWLAVSSSTFFYFQFVPRDVSACQATNSYQYYINWNQFKLKIRIDKSLRKYKLHLISIEEAKPI